MFINRFNPKFVFSESKFNSIYSNSSLPINLIAPHTAFKKKKILKLSSWKYRAQGCSSIIFILKVITDNCLCSFTHMIKNTQSKIFLKTSVRQFIFI